MKTITRDNTASTSGILHDSEDALNKASLSAHAAVNSLAGAADEALEQRTTDLLDSLKSRERREILYLEFL